MTIESIISQASAVVVVTSPSSAAYIRGEADALKT